MATRSKQFFMTLEEFCRWIRAAAEDLSLSVVLLQRRGEVLESWNGTNEELGASGRVFLATEDPVLGCVDARNLQPGRHGWVQIDVPRESENELALCQLAARSDWFDKDESVVQENLAALKLYEKIWKRLRASLSFPVWVRNEMTGDAAPYESIGYSDGAADFFHLGHQLKQEGVGNLRFEIRDEHR